MQHRTLQTRLAACVARGALLLLAAAGPAPAGAQEFPARPVRIITTFPAGSGPETVLRLLSDKVTRNWGRQVTVENRPGGNGFIAIEAFKRSPADGHELIQLDGVHLSVYPHLFRNLPYDPRADFEPLLPLFRAGFFLTVSAQSKYRNVGEIIADARANPGRLNYGSWSVGNPVHLGLAQLELLTGTQMAHIIYKETNQLYAAVASGELALSLGSSGTAGPLYRAGKLKFLAIAAPRRNPAFADIPTVAEAGGPAGYEVVGWTTIAAPRGVPRPATDRIQAEFERAIAEPDVRERYTAFGYEASSLSREQFLQQIQAESARYADVIRRMRISLD